MVKWRWKRRFEDKTYEVILKQMLDQVPAGMDKREGSIIYSALAPASMELAATYMELDTVLKEVFADTADREYLIRRAAERGVIPKGASYAELKGEFNMDIPIGSRFSLDELNYIAIERLENGEYRMQCETPGTAGNNNFGTLIPIEYIKGLTKAELTEVLIPGEDEEETEHFRKRYFESLNSQAFGGNIADYKKKVSAISGVGGVKVLPAWNGGGTVKLVIVDSSYNIPTADLIETVQDTIDPDPNRGKGYGLAPIGHVVTVTGAEAEKVSVTTNITYQTGYDKSQCMEDISRVIDEYLTELNRSWQEVNEIVVRVSRIESKLLDVAGILDVLDTCINGVSGNYLIPSERIAVRGDIHV